MTIPFHNIYKAKHSSIKKDLEDRGLQSTGDLNTDRRILQRSQISMIGGGKIYTWDEVDKIENQRVLITLYENGSLLGTMTVSTVKALYGIEG